LKCGSIINGDTERFPVLWLFNKDSIQTILHRFGWLVIRPYSLYLNFRYHVTTVYNDPPPKPPFILIANHGSYLDAFLLMAHCPPVSFVVNEEAVTSPLRKLTAFIYRMNPKQKGRSNINSAEKIRRLVNCRHAAGFFPEGDRSWDGETAQIPFSAAKLISLLGVPVLCAAITGSYLAFPRWASARRRGIVRIVFTTIPAKKIGEISREQLYELIRARLNVNDMKNACVSGMSFDGKGLAEGVGFLLWLCPVCKSHDSISGTGSGIYCSLCQKKWTLDGNLKIKPVLPEIYDLKDWSDFQKTHVKQSVEAALEKTLLTKTDRISIEEFDGRRANTEICGDIMLYKNEMQVLPKPDTSLSPIVFGVGKIRHFADNFNRFSRFDYEGKMYRIYFNGRNSLKWIDYWKYLNRQNAPSV
jgi:1-acyl-sn-glycerol-3-phosphate acyltransferase